MLLYQGPLKVYFNRHQAAPLVWCVGPSNGDWEMAVKVVKFSEVHAETVYNPPGGDDDDTGRSSAWIFLDDATLEVDNQGRATCY